jgi:hypothetical protein
MKSAGGARSAVMDSTSNAAVSIAATGLNAWNGASRFGANLHMTRSPSWYVYV